MCIMPKPFTVSASKCPHCGLDSCYHCWECGADVSSERHGKGCSGDKSPTVPICIACQGTGRSSSNKRCYPCNGTGRHGAVNDVGEMKIQEVTVEVQQDNGSLWD